jgi:hypothetical protein
VPIAVRPGWARWWHRLQPVNRHRAHLPGDACLRFVFSNPVNHRQAAAERNGSGLVSSSPPTALTTIRRQGSQPGPKKRSFLFILVHSDSTWLHLASASPPGPKPRCTPIGTPPRRFSHAFSNTYSPRRQRFSPAVLHYGQGRKAPRSLPNMDRGHQPEVHGYWIKGLPKWATAVSKSALIHRKLSINKPGPWSGLTA